MQSNICAGIRKSIRSKVGYILEK